MHRLGMRTLVVVAGLAVASGLAYTASAEPGGDPESAPRAPAADALAEVAEWATGHGKANGYGKVEIDEAHATVRIYWDGEPPADVVARDGAAVDGVTVDVVRTRYADQELSAAGEKILGAYGGLVVYTHPNDDLSGLVVAVDETADAAARAKITAPILAGQVGMPVTVIEDEPFRDLIADAF